MVDSNALFGVIAIGFAVAFGTELMQYLLIYSKRSFRLLKENFEKEAKKVEEARDNKNNARAVKKRESRLQGWEEEASKTLAAANFKAGAIVMVSVLLSWRIIPRLFGGVVVARLPFNPPAFMLKATHRGLEGADPREASALFIFMLCQACFRAILNKVLDWGPSRKMQEVKPYIPKAMKNN